ncbi:MAG: gluconate 2-dehydrogenase subunit 3 family protein [Chitinophagales bacterium]
MKRRKAIGRILLFGGGTVAAYSGYKWYTWIKRPNLDWLKTQRELISALAETIIPKTDTPGAVEAGVADYIVLIISDCTEIKSQNKFIDGLQDLADYCQSEFHKPFTQCSQEERISVLKHFEEKGRPLRGIWGKAQNKFLGRSFFTTLQEYTVSGYCSSEVGATKALSYVAVPGRYLGCIPLASGQTSWATK